MTFFLSFALKTVYPCTKDLKNCFIVLHVLSARLKLCVCFFFFIVLLYCLIIQKDLLLLCSNTFKLYAAGSAEYNLAKEIKKHFYSRLDDMAPKKSKKTSSRSKSKTKSTSNKVKDNIAKNEQDIDILMSGTKEQAQLAFYHGMDDVDMSQNGSQRRGLRVRKQDGYQLIEDYVNVCDNEYLEEQLTTKKKGNCDGVYCSDLNELGPFDNASERWESKCRDRSKNIECGNDCKCNSDNCLNRGMSMNRGKILGRDVREQKVYGIDAYTRENLETIMPDNLCELTGNKNAKVDFIETKILPTINAYQTVVSTALPQYASKKTAFGNKRENKEDKGKDTNMNKNKNKNKNNGNDNSKGEKEKTKEENGKNDKKNEKNKDKEKTKEEENTGIMTRSRTRKKRKVNNKSTKITDKYTRAKQTEPQKEDDVRAPFFMTDVLRVLLHTAESREEGMLVFFFCFLCFCFCFFFVLLFIGFDFTFCGWYSS